MTITVQIDEKGGIPLKEHSDELRAALRSFAEKEVGITVRESTDFSHLINEAVNLQNRFSRAVNEESKTWTQEDFSLLRAKMSTVYTPLSDAFAVAKSDEKTTASNLDGILSTQKVRFIEIDGHAPMLAMSKAKTTKEYESANEAYLQAYKYRTSLEQLIRSLDGSMNAISGIQKVGLSYLKF